MKQVQMKLLLCLLLASSVTGQFGGSSMFGGQGFGGQQLGMGGFGGYSGAGGFGQYGQQAAGGLSGLGGLGGYSGAGGFGQYGQQAAGGLSGLGGLGGYAGAGGFGQYGQQAAGGSPWAGLTGQSALAQGAVAQQPAQAAVGQQTLATADVSSSAASAPVAQRDSSGGDGGGSGGSSYGSGSSYGGGSSSYGSGGAYGNNNYGSSYSQSTGTPYGIQSTGEYTKYYTENLDLSKCGPTPTDNPCTAYGPQYYPLPGYPNCYIQCAFERLFVKPCPANLVWNERINVCDWPTVASAPAYGGSNYGSTSYGNGGSSYGSSSSYGTPSSSYGSQSSYSYGKKKRSTTERKKRGHGNQQSYGGRSNKKDYGNYKRRRPSLPFPPFPIGLPLAPFALPGPVGFPGLVGLPGLPPPIGIPPPIPPIGGPIGGGIIGPGPIGPPILPPPIIPPIGPFIPPLPVPLSVSLIPGPAFPFGPPFGGPFGGPLIPPFGGPFEGGFGGGFGGLGGFGGGLGGFGGGLGGFGGGLGGFGGGLGGFGGGFGEFGGGLGGLGGFGGLGGGFGEFGGGLGGFGGLGGGLGGFGGGFGEFGGGLGGFGGGFGEFGGGLGGLGGGFGEFGGLGEFGGGFEDPFIGELFGSGYGFGDDYGGNDYSNFNIYGKPYGNRNYENNDNYGGDSYSNSYSYDDNDDSDTSDYQRNGRFDGYGSGSYENRQKGYSYRKKRQYYSDATDVQIPKVSLLERQRVFTPLPQQQQYQTSYNPVQVSSFASIQQPRLISTQVIQSPPPQPPLCVGQPPRTNIQHPTDATKYIACLTETSFEVMDCPNGLVYNGASDQCQKLQNPETICERDQPCMNDGQCHQTSPTTYKCTCRGAWTGERCETPVSSCAADPCGQGNECHTLKTSDYKQDFVCVCDDRQSYGLTCGRNTVPNPCLAASIEQEQYYPFAFSAQAFVQCNGDLLYVQPCASGLYWNQEAKVCDRIETSPVPTSITTRDQSQSYQVTYDTQQQPAYARPTASFGEQKTFQNYQTQANIASESSLNKIISPKQISSFQILSRQFKEQPKDNYATVQERPIITSETSWSSPYGQTSTTDTDQSSFVAPSSQTSFVPQKPSQSVFIPQQPKSRTLVRVFQPELTKNWNVPPTQSAYRR